METRSARVPGSRAGARPGAISLIYAPPALLGLIGAALAGAALLLGGCSKNPDLQRLFSLEGRTAEGGPPRSVEELQAGIAQYSKVAETVVEAGAKVGTYYELLATRYLEKGMYRDAYQALAKAVGYFPDVASLHYNAGLSAAYVAKSEAIRGPAGAAEKERWFAVSEANYKRALDINPRMAGALYGLAVLYSFELGRPAESEPLLRRLLDVEKRNADAMLLLARSYYAMGRLEDAANWYETAAKSTGSPDKRRAAEENRARVVSEIGGKANGK
jgi:tetratricopeptide (TPR) repeat protein